MDRTTVEEAPDLTALFPHKLPNRVTVTLQSGERLTSEIVSGPGSLETPMTDADFERKFRKVAAPHLSSHAQDDVIAFTYMLDRQPSYAALFGAMSPNSDERISISG